MSVFDLNDGPGSTAQPRYWETADMRLQLALIKSGADHPKPVMSGRLLGRHYLPAVPIWLSFGCSGSHRS